MAESKTRTTRLTRAALLLGGFFALDKGVAFVRQVIIAQQFGLSAELDAFNVANNLPDMLFALISGGALAMAFIPVLSEVLNRDGQKAAWDLFSRIANLAFLVTAGLAVVVLIFAPQIVRSEVGIAPGFGTPQQDLVIDLMRLNLVATLIFSISGLVIAGLQANKHFLLPALAPILYNIGQIFGALILAPQQGYTLGSVTLPAFGMGVHGLVYGVVIGAILHLGIQIPGLIRYHFQWTPKIGIRTEGVAKVLGLMGPRLITMFFIQLIFIARDNFASRLEVGSVTALTYGWMIFQVPETLIGTAIGTAMLPTLSELAASQQWTAFRRTVENAIRVLVALTLPIAAVLSFGLRPLLSLAFGFDDAGTDLLLWVTRAYLLGLAGQCLMEVAARSFYARQDAITPLITAGINLTLYVALGYFLSGWLGAPGISLADAIAFTIQAAILFLLLNRHLPVRLRLEGSLWRGILAALAGGVATAAIVWFGRGSPVLFAIAGLAAGGLIALPILWKELRILLRL